MEATDFEEEHKFTPDNYRILEQVRRGKITSDFMVLHEIEDKKYAMKKIFLAKHTEKLKQIACQEMKLLSNLKNPYIVKYEDSWIDKESNACIFTTYYEGGNMTNAIKKARGKLFPEEKIFKWLTQLLLAVNYLHTNRVLHMDLTCSNIYLPKDDHIQLGNYGLAKLVNPEKPTSLVSGISNSMCPEVLEDQPYGYKSDIWSLGCCMYEITGHQPAFKAPDKAGLINKINRSLLSPLPIVYSSTLKQMIKLMLRKKPEHRPTACELLRNPSLQPYLLECHSLSPIYLPVFPIISPNDKTRRNSLPAKSAKEIKSISKSDVSRSLENLYPVWTKAETGSSSSSQPASSTNAGEDKLETKRIDPSCNTLNIKSDLDIAIYTQTDLTNTGKYVDVGFESETQEDDTKLSVSNTEVTVARDCVSGNLEVGEDKTDPSCNTLNISDHKSDLEIAIYTQTENMFSEEPQLRNVDVGHEPETQELSVSNTEVTVTRDSVSENLEIGEEKTAKLTVSEMTTVLSKLTKLGPPQSKERADALECLLEKCAGLVKKEKYEELAGLLIPFGEEGVSARDTAIWFAKTLLSSDKVNQGT